MIYKPLLWTLIAGNHILTKYEALSQSEKIANLQYHLLEIGTLSKNSLSPEYFDCLPPLTELEIETVCINFNSFLDETNCSVPDLEELPNPDMTDVPSFLGQNYQTRDCTRVLRSHKKASSTYHPFSLYKKSFFICLKIIHFLIFIYYLNKRPLFITSGL